MDLKDATEAFTREKVPGCEIDKNSWCFLVRLSSQKNARWA